MTVCWARLLRHFANICDNYNSSVCHITLSHLLGLTYLHFTSNTISNKITENVINGKYSTHKIHYISRRIILIGYLRHRLWACPLALFNWSTKGNSGELLWQIPGIHKMRKMSWLSKKLIASQDGLAPSYWLVMVEYIEVLRYIKEKKIITLF